MTNTTAHIQISSNSKVYNVHVYTTCTPHDTLNIIGLSNSSNYTQLTRQWILTHMYIHNHCINRYKQFVNEQVGEVYKYKHFLPVDTNTVHRNDYIVHLL